MLGQHHLRQFLALSGPERRLLVRAFVDLITVDLALRMLGSKRVLARAWASAERPAGLVDSDKLNRARQYARTVETASRHHLISARCLHCSLVLHRWLEKERLPSTLRIGVRKVDGRMQAHAWVEVDGQVVSESGADVTSFILLSSPLSRRLDWAPVIDARYANAAPGLECE